VAEQALEAGIEVDYVKSLIKRRELVPEHPVEGWPYPYRVQTFGGFRLLRHDEPLPTTGKAQRRPLELLKTLLAYGGEQVSESRVTDALWPRIDGDSAHRSFTSALHRLRKLLGEDRAVVLHEGKLTLDRRYFWVDAWAFENLAAELEATTDLAKAEKLAERILALYRGPFMADEVDAAWVLQPRERMRGRLARTITRVVRRWEEAGQPERARACYEKCVELEAFKQSADGR
jgi:DNA-binding SARP family transcriptional activator